MTARKPMAPSVLCFEVVFFLFCFCLFLVELEGGGLWLGKEALPLCIPQKESFKDQLKSCSALSYIEGMS